MQGACFFACSNMSRTLEAPTPTNISTKSEPEMEKNGTFASPAMALASEVLPVPGDPTINVPRGNTAAEALELARIAQEFDEFDHIFLRLVDARHVVEGRLDLIFGEKLRLALAEREGPATPTDATLHLAHEQHEDGDDDEDREARYEKLRPDALLLFFLSVISTPCSYRSSTSFGSAIGGRSTSNSSPVFFVPRIRSRRSLRTGLDPRAQA